MVDGVECGKEFIAKFQFKKHVLWHSGERPHVCDLFFNGEPCGKSYKSGSELNVHKRSARHTGVNPRHQRHQCTMVVDGVPCGKILVGKTALIYHMKTHTGERPFKGVGNG